MDGDVDRFDSNEDDRDLSPSPELSFTETRFDPVLDKEKLERIDGIIVKKYQMVAELWLFHSDLLQCGNSRCIIIIKSLI